MPDRLTAKYTDEAGNRRRLRLEARDSGGWDRVVEELDDGEWRHVGGEIVADVDVEISGELLLEVA